MMRPSALLACAVAAALAPAVSAQRTDVVAPGIYANSEGNDISRYPFGWTDFRMQQIVLEGEIVSQNGLISGIAYRPDTSNSIGSQAITFPNVTVTLSQTTQSPATMSSMFASNITGPTQVCYQGPVSLPDHTSTPGQIGAWAEMTFTTPFVISSGLGNLLIDISAADPTGSTQTSWIPDGALPGGTYSSFGTAGTLSQPDSVDLIVNGTGPAGRYSGMVPGSFMSMTVQSFFTPLSGVLLTGFTPLAQPVDLGPLGAPGNSIYVTPNYAAPFTLQPTFFNYSHRFDILIPNTPAMIGAKLFSQPASFDPAANSLGIVTSMAREITIGELPHPIEQVHSNHHMNLSGDKIYPSFQGGSPVRLIGTFF